MTTANKSGYCDYMPSTDHDHVSALVGARELKTRLGTYLRQVKSGTTLIVTERGRPIAELRPLPTYDDVLPAALAELTASGVLGGEIRERSRLGAFEPIVNRGAPVADAIDVDREDRF